MQFQYNIIRIDLQNLRARIFCLPNSRHVSHSYQVGSFEKHASKHSDVIDKVNSEQASVALNVVVHLCHKTVYILR